MTIRRLNYTGRQRIRRRDVRITIHKSDDGPSRFDADLKLAGYELPYDAPVFVEAYRQSIWMRFRYGTAGSVLPEDKPILSEFDSPDGLLFRVKITSVGHPSGILLAEADRIPPREPAEDEEQRIPLLSARADRDLGDQVFQIDFDDRPILLVNANLDDWRTAVHEPAFISLVYPVAVRQILTRILDHDHPGEIEEDGDWPSQWLKFATFLPGVPNEIPGKDADEENKDRWIDEVVSSFCRQHQMLNEFNRYLSGESSS